jgi:mono/diheme cytochrome c family protein
LTLISNWIENLPRICLRRICDEDVPMSRLNQEQFSCVILSFIVVAGFSMARAQDAPDVGPHPPTPPKLMESHIGNITGHSQDAKHDYRRYCAGCHGDLGDGNGENAAWLDPKPRDFTMAIFKCRSTVTGTLPTDEDLFNTVARGLTNSNMPVWNTFTRQERADLVAYIKTFSARWQKEKPGEPIKIPPEPPITIQSISHGKELFTKLECWKCHGPEGKGDGPAAATLTDSKDNLIRPYDFSGGKEDSRFKCGSTNSDLYKIFITGVDGTPMPSYADVIQPSDAWDLVHFLRTLQTKRQSKENDVLKAAGGVIPPYVEKQSEGPVTPSGSRPSGGS